MAAINLAYIVVEKLLAIYLIIAGWELFGVICGWLMGLVLSSITGLILTARFLGMLEKPHPVKPLINFSYPLYLSGILAFAVNWIDQLFILPYMGVVYLGMYHIATRAALVPSLISSSIFVALFPKLSELYTRGGADSLKEAFHVTTRYVVMAGFPVIVGLAVLAYPAMVLFAGVEYAEAALPLTVLCLAQLPVTLGVAISPTLMTLERTKTRLMLNVAYILFETFMSYIALAHLNLGMPGAGWARAFTGLIGFGLAVYALRRTLTENEKRQFKVRLIPYIVPDPFCVVDRERDNGLVLVYMRNFRYYESADPFFIFRRSSAHEELFEFFVREFEALWEAAAPYSDK